MRLVPVLVGVLMGCAVWLALPAAAVAGARSRARQPDGDEQQAARVTELADVADLLALVLAAGSGVIEAMELLAEHYPGVLGRQLRTVVAAARWGVDEEARWAAVSPQWAPIRRALRIADEAGVAPAQMLSAAADDLRRAEAHRVDVAASTFSALAVLPLGLAFLPGFLLSAVVPVVLALATDLMAG